MQKIFDGHNDILLRLHLAGDKKGAGFITGRKDTHIDAPRAKAGGLCGGFFAVFAPSGDGKARGMNTSPLPHKRAKRDTDSMVSILRNLTQKHPGVIRLARSAEDTEDIIASDAMAAILHFEGAEAILPDCSNLEEYYKMGLRSIGPVWSRENAFGTGVPFDFPGDPDIGDGLTDAGCELVRECERLRIMLDLSHLNAAGFRDVARLSSRPLVATHSNMHTICPSPRNLTPWQMDAIAESGGLVGVNFAAAFLRPDGRKTADTPMDVLFPHIDGLLAVLGENGVALGSDFDGALIPSAIGDCAGLPALAQMLAARYGTDLADKICRRNWLRQIRLQIG